jgi:hypothetical protein
MPFQVGIKSEGKYKIYNFGFTGYGPHQMLSAIEHELVENVVTSNKPVFAIYSAHVDHVERSAGRLSWDQHGPRYILHNDGTVEYTGSFDDKKESLLSMSVKKSHALKSSNPYSQKNIDLFVNIISASEAKLKKLYPELRFYVLLWDKGLDEYNKIIYDGLRAKGINTYRISKIVPDYTSDNEEKYYLSMHDKHPNAFINEIIAEYIVNSILEK